MARKRRKAPVVPAGLKPLCMNPMQIVRKCKKCNYKTEDSTCPACGNPTRLILE